MKLIMSFMLLFLFSMSIKAEYMPFLNDGRAWIIAHYISCEDPVYYKVDVEESEMIGKKECFRLTRVPVEQTADGWEVIGGEKMEWWAYEHEGTLYDVYLDHDKSMTRIQPVFSLDWTSDKWPHKIPVRVERTINGEPRICLCFVNIIDEEIGWIVEGIGGNISGIWMGMPTSGPHTYQYSYMVECLQDGEVIFTKEDFENLTLPGEFTSRVQDFPEVTEQASKAYNLQGIPVDTSHKGFVIVNGKQLVNR